MKSEELSRPVLGDVDGESSAARVKRYVENTNRYLDWSMDNPTTWQVSYPRSGRTWLSLLMENVTGKWYPDPANVNCGSYEYPYFRVHGFGDPYHRALDRNADLKVILLVRDPRDCAISDAYRRVYHDQAIDVHTMSIDLIEETVKDVCDQWGDRIYYYQRRAGLVVSYENLCIFPHKNIERILEFLGEDPVKDINAVITTHDRVKRVHLLREENDEGKNIKKVTNSVLYTNGYERYFQSCMKWVNNPLFLEEFNRRIFSELGGFMWKFGYTEHGHKLDLIETLDP